jgi:hypothetical protein
MKFNSQICTTREQSERLFSLGLKKETADMVWTHAYYSTWAATAKENPLYFHEADEDTIPAWSLHRLIEIMPQCIYHKNRMCFLFIDQSVYVLYGASQTIVEQFMKSNLWDNLINCIEWLIKEGYFNKEYLTGN